MKFLSPPFVQTFSSFVSLLVSSSQELLLVNRLDSHPEEEDGDEGDDEDHEEGDGDPDEGRGVHAERVGHAVGVDNDLFLFFFRSQGELNIVGGQNLKENNTILKNCQAFELYSTLMSHL